MNKKKNIHLNIAPWNGPDIVACFNALGDDPYTIFFDSNRPSHPLNNYSILCWMPEETIHYKNGHIRYNQQGKETDNVFEFLGNLIKTYDIKVEEINLPFYGGMAGFFSYDLGRDLETIPASTTDDINMDDIALGIYTNTLIYDHKTKKHWIITKDDDGKNHLLKKIKALKKHSSPIPEPDWYTQTPEGTFKENIKRVIEYIHAGDIYQANLTRRFEAVLPDGFNPAQHYNHLRHINAAPFGAYMKFNDVTLCSTSPERFLNLSGRQVETRPIKGTLPSSMPATMLAHSEKDRAENTMIVDLMRNDLSKVCRTHSVQAPQLCQVETFEGLHHLVSVVTGVLAENNDAFDLLESCFPGGSITGAPKIRAMEIIDELEPTRRGAYCGAMGYIGFNGDMDTNIAIRTLIYKNGRAYLQTGSGIVSDSTAEKELQETLDKAEKIFESFAPNHKVTQNKQAS